MGGLEVRKKYIKKLFIQRIYMKKFYLSLVLFAMAPMVVVADEEKEAIEVTETKASEKAPETKVELTKDDSKTKAPEGPGLFSQATDVVCWPFITFDNAVVGGMKAYPRIPGYAIVVTAIAAGYNYFAAEEEAEADSF